VRVAAQRNDRARVEERRRRCAIGQAEAVADRPFAAGNLPLEQVKGLDHRCLRLCHAVRIRPPFRAQPVDHGLGDVSGDEAVEKAIPHPRLQRRPPVVRDQRFLGRRDLVEILDDDARLRDDPRCFFVAQHRELHHRPNGLQAGAVLRIAEIDQHRLEGQILLVERDQRLLTEGGERVIVELQHGPTPQPGGAALA
jgi:hypothetical protein